MANRKFIIGGKVHEATDARKVIVGGKVLEEDSGGGAPPAGDDTLLATISNPGRCIGMARAARLGGELQ